MPHLTLIFSGARSALILNQNLAYSCRALIQVSSGGVNRNFQNIVNRRRKIGNLARMLLVQRLKLRHQVRGDPNFLLQNPSPPKSTGHDYRCPPFGIPAQLPNPEEFWRCQTASTAAGLWRRLLPPAAGQPAVGLVSAAAALVFEAIAPTLPSVRLTRLTAFLVRQPTQLFFQGCNPLR